MCGAGIIWADLRKGLLERSVDFICMEVKLRFLSLMRVALRILSHLAARYENDKRLYSLGGDKLWCASVTFGKGAGVAASKGGGRGTGSNKIRDLPVFP